MRPRTGRPRINNPKNVEIKARIDEKMNAALVEYCNINDVTRTDVIREGIRRVVFDTKRKE